MAPSPQHSLYPCENDDNSGRPLITAKITWQLSLTWLPENGYEHYYLCMICRRTDPIDSFVWDQMSISSTWRPWLGKRTSNVRCFPLQALWGTRNDDASWMDLASWLTGKHRILSKSLFIVHISVRFGKKHGIIESNHCTVLTNRID